jgi:hypothetical protein
LDSLAAQEPAPQADALHVFLDCQTFWCDFDHFRREIPFVNGASSHKARRIERRTAIDSLHE